MAKKYKVKRYRSIYRGSPRKRVGRGLLIAAAALLLFGAGWFLYQPIYDMFFDRPTPSLIDPGESSREDGESSQADEASQSEEPVPGVLPQVDEIKAAYVPAGVIANTAALDSYISSLPKSRVNTVVVDIKDDEGILLYQSALPLVGEASAQAEVTYNLAGLVNKFHAAGLRVLGRMGTFKDHMAASSLEGGEVKYQGTDYSWLDNAPEAGGRSWLNPYARPARDYLLSIAGEAMDSGLDGLVLTGLRFPEGLSLARADYGDTGDVSRADALAGFAAEVSELVTGHEGMGSWVWLSAREYLAPDTAELGPYGGDIASFAQKAGSLMLDVTPVSFGTAFEGEGIALAAPMTRPGETVSQVMAAMELPEGSLAVLQGYTPTGFAAEYVTEVDTAQVDAQIAAARAGGAGGYLLFDPSGAYPALR